MRYAVYFTPPPDDPLTRLAANWLQRDAFGGPPPPFPPDAGLSAAEAWTATSEPRRYGFHATLKAPFHLAPGRDEGELVRIFEAFCDAQPAFAMPRLVLRALGSFLALVPEGPSPALDRLAADAVAEFEPFRAPLDANEFARRRPERLSASERANLKRWGYPYVFADFRFHMTLTGSLPPERLPAVEANLAALFGPELAKTRQTAGLGLFVQPGDGAFQVLRFAPLAVL